MIPSEMRNPSKRLMRNRIEAQSKRSTELVINRRCKSILHFCLRLIFPRHFVFLCPSSITFNSTLLYRAKCVVDTILVSHFVFFDRIQSSYHLST